MANKLYTEEQVRDMLSGAMHSNWMDAFLSNYTPIELPSDEEIVKKFTIGNTEYTHKIEGANWLKEKILNNGK